MLLLVLFALAWTLPTLTCLVCGKSFIWQIDGLSQQYVWYAYVGQWIRELFSNVFVSHTFEVPQWESAAGYGADVIQMVGGYFVNPLYWTSALLPESLAEVGLEAVTLVTLYGAGLSFSAWALGRGVTREGALLGAVAYMFSGFTVVLFTQPSFITTLAVFPLVLLCADRVFDRLSPLPFVLVLAWCFAYSFYDSYMVCILLVGYCLVRFFADLERERPRAGRAARLLRWVAAFVGYVALSLLLSCFLMLPQVMGLIGADRLSVDRSDGVLYGLSWYVNFFAGLLSYDNMGSDAYVGFNAVAPVALVLLFMRRREHRGPFVAFCALTVMMVLPEFGRLMNGFEYASNRWGWAYALCVAYVVARLLPEVGATTARERRVAAAVVIAYVALVVFLPLPGSTISAFASMFVALGALAVCLGGWLWPRPRLMAALACLAALSGAVLLACYISPYFGNWATQLMGVGKSWQFHSSNGVQKFVDQAQESGVDYDETYRYDRTTPVANAIHNSGMLTGLLSTDFYCSIYSQGIDDFNTSLGLVDTEGTNFRYGSLNSRSMLDGLLGVRYFYLDAQFEAMLPETFRDGTVIAEGPGRGDTYALYETDVVAPLAFSTSTYLTRSQYESLAMEDRQKALLYGVVLEDDDEVAGLSNVADEIASSLNTQDVAYEVESVSCCDVEGDVEAVQAGTGALTVTSRCSGSSITLKFSSPADAEVYLMASGLTYEDIPFRARYTESEWEALGYIGRLKVRLADLFRTETTNGLVTVEASGTRSLIYQMNESDHMYGGKHDWMVNIGYSEDGLTEVKLTFGSAGTYTFQSLRVVAQPMEGVDEAIEELADAGASDIVIGTNEMSATSSSEEDGLLFWSVAYSEGWSATVDGEPAVVHEADLGFMAVEVPAGEHEVRLEYRTPYLVEGCELTGVGVVATALTCVARRRRRCAKEVVHSH